MLLRCCVLLRGGMLLWRSVLLWRGMLLWCSVLLWRSMLRRSSMFSQERHAIEAQPSAQFLPLAWLASSAQFLPLAWLASSTQFLPLAWLASSAQPARRASPRPGAWRQPRSAGVRRWPWHRRIYRPSQSLVLRLERWWAPCADRARQPAPMGWQHAESRPGRRYRKRGSGWRSYFSAHSPGRCRWCESRSHSRA